MKFLVYFFGFCVFYGNVMAKRPLETGSLSDLHFEVDGFNYRLPNNTKPEHYDISLVTFVDRKDFNFSGVVKIDLSVIEESTNITLQARLLTIEKVLLRDTQANSVDGITFTYEEETEFVTVLTGDKVLQRGEKYTLEIAYSGELRNITAGFYKTSYINEQGDEVWLASTQFQTTVARHGFPCFDEPGLKATFDVHIQHGPTYSAFSNMPGKDETNSDGSVTTHFETTPLMSTYLVAFVVADFKATQAKKEITYRVISAPKDVNRTGYALKEGEALINAIAGYVGVPFSLPKLDQAAIPKFPGGMENWGLVIYGDNFLLVDEDDHDTQDTTTLMSHELGHQWFGNLVSPKWWSYSWLNEGFATLFAYIGTDLVHPDWNIFDDFVSSNVRSVLSSDAGNDTHPMTHYVESPEQVARIFDMITYAKAGSVIRMFLHAFTEESFKKALNYYLIKMSYQGAEEDDLFSAIEKAVKEDKTLDAELNIKDIFGSWSRQEGFPLLNVSRNYEDGSVTLYQERYTSDYPNADAKKRTWWIPYNFVSTKTGDFSNTKPDGWLPAGVTSQKIELTLSNDDWIVFNKQQIGYYRVLYDDKNYKLIQDELNAGDKSKIHPLSRAQIIDDLKDFVKTGRVPPQTFFELISYLKKETNYVPWSAAKAAFSDIDLKLQDTDKKSKFYSFVAALVEPVYREVRLNAEKDVPRKMRKLRKVITDVACKYGVQLCLDDTHKQFEDTLRGRAESSPNTRGLAFAHGIRNADEQQVKALWARFENSKNVYERKEIIESFGNVKDEAIIKEYLYKSIQPAAEFSQSERQSLVESIAFGSKFGLFSVMQLLRENMEVANKEILNLDKLLGKLAERIVTPELYKEFSKLLQTSKAANSITDKNVEKMHTIVVNEINRHHPQLENSIPSQ